MPEQGDIVLVPVPFTDLSSQKRRPVIVISSDTYNRSGADIIVVAMTSNPTPVPYSFRITSNDLVPCQSLFLGCYHFLVTRRVSEGDTCFKVLPRLRFGLRLPLPTLILSSDKALVAGALNRPGTVRVDKIYTLAQAIVVRQFGKVAPEIIERIRQGIETITEPST